MEVPEPTTIEIGPHRFDALVAGPRDGPLVILCHGFPQTSRSWHRLMPPLARDGHLAVAPDGRGLSPGARPTALSEYRIDALVADVLGVADSFGRDRFHLVGHDWGGLQAWQVAGRHPDRVASLTVLSTPHNRAFREALEDPSCDQAERSGYFETFRTPGAGEDMWLGQGADGLRELYRLAGLTGDEAEPYVEAFQDREALTGLLSWYRAGEPTWDEGLGKIRVPTLYCWGARDPALGRAAVDRTGDWVEGPYRLEVFEETGHWLPEHGGERLERLLRAHLAEFPIRG